MLEPLVRQLLVGFTRFFFGAHPAWTGCAPLPVQRIYFANHSSHMDGLTLHSALPGNLRALTSLVAARDYWNATALRRYISTRCLRAVLLDREAHSRAPLQPLLDALDSGRSLIIFPEGTRHRGRLPQPFKPGLYHLAKHRPQVDLVPVYLENLHRTLPKGHYLPLPILCIPRFGEPLRLQEGEAKAAFLDRARDAVAALARPQNKERQFLVEVD